MNTKELEIKRGYIYMCKLGEGIGSEQGGTRPVLVIKNQKGIDNSPVITIIPITSKINKGKKLPTHVSIGTDSGLLVDSDLQIEQITRKNKKDFLFYNTNKQNCGLRKLGKASDYILKQVEIALSKDTGFIGLYFNEKYAFKLLDAINEIKNITIAKIAKKLLVDEFKDYCLKYNKDYNAVRILYNSNKLILLKNSHRTDVINCRQCS